MPIPRSWRAPLLAALLAVFAAPALRAQATMVPDTGLTVVHLVMGQGKMVWEKFGHDAIWIHDPAAGTDRVYNYGVFDFASPGFMSRFIAGNLLYELGVSDIQNTLFQYQYFNRAVWGQELNLTAAQKRELQRLLEVNALPQNKDYLYDYYRDNCSTRIRDVVDRVIGGRLRAATEKVPTNTTYRWHSERLIAGDPVSYTGITGGLGPAADHRISRWEEMFLPFKVQERFREATVLDEAGREVPLVKREWTLVEAQGRPAPLPKPPTWTPWFLVAGLLIGGALVAMGRAAPRSGLARMGFGAVSALWLLFAGVGGFVLVYLWSFTNHRIAYGNENMLQLSPLALPLILLVPCVAYGVRWAARPAWVLTAAVAALSVFGFVAQVLPWLDQRNAQMIALAMPINLALAWTVRRLTRSGHAVR
ncbi:MAG TPA: DUF4105 domain-containing protein [Longimicrobium sp.]|jgi:hypothetical protein|uniref:lipoprotein N-acyltransferase Lnb domain-containing protein n=1 Tax=Longimicrobium sp. TaxID=2029185 RepID=UPI002ED80DC5